MISSTSAEGPFLFAVLVVVIPFWSTSPAKESYLIKKGVCPLKFKDGRTIWLPQNLLNSVLKWACLVTFLVSQSFQNERHVLRILRLQQRGNNCFYVFPEKGGGSGGAESLKTTPQSNGFKPVQTQRRNRPSKKATRKALRKVKVAWMLLSPSILQID